MAVIIDKKINWKATLLGLVVGEEMTFNKPSIQDVQTSRTWSSKLKKEGVYTNISVKGSVLTVKRIA